MNSAAGSAGLPLLIYDDGCPLCRAIAAAIRRRDRNGQLLLVALSGAGETLDRLGLSRDDARRDVRLALPDGRIFRGAAVVAPVVAMLRGWSWLAPLLRVRPFSHLFAGFWLLTRQLRHEVR